MMVRVRFIDPPLRPNACVALSPNCRGRVQAYLCFCTLSNPFSNWVTSGVSPYSRPSRPMTRQRKLPIGSWCPSYTAIRSSEGRLVTRMMTVGLRGSVHDRQLAPLLNGVLHGADRV